MGFSDEVIKRCRELCERLRAYPDILESQREVLEEIYDLMERSNAIHVYGIGRSGSAALSLALRLKHFRYNVWFIGDIVKERIKENDVVILFSGSGVTAEIVNIAESAKQEGAKVVAISSYRESPLGRLADVFLYLPGGMRKGERWGYTEAQLTESPFYGAGEFEVLAYLFQETLVTAIGKFKGILPSKVVEEHFRDQKVVKS
ncbi:MAG: SIS domain-containing protein [Canidatus Methanoxibalbensis ujae]|nr:SIS domain-containing protein [Candidatus Methanoxibalbensis ujae]MCW7077512.1 SIS domain-containing protein [Candidatus Methanoxibalbensis ujae]